MQCFKKMLTRLFLGTTMKKGSSHTIKCIFFRENRERQKEEEKKLLYHHSHHHNSSDELCQLILGERNVTK